MSCDDVRLKSIINLLPSISQRKPEEESVEESVPHVDQRIPVLTNIVVVDVVIVVVILHYVTIGFQNGLADDGEFALGFQESVKHSHSRRHKDLGHNTLKKKIFSQTSALFNLISFSLKVSTVVVTRIVCQSAVHCVHCHWRPGLTTRVNKISFASSQNDIGIRAAQAHVNKCKHLSQRGIGVSLKH